MTTSKSASPLTKVSTPAEATVYMFHRLFKSNTAFTLLIGSVAIDGRRRLRMASLAHSPCFQSVKRRQPFDGFEDRSISDTRADSPGRCVEAESGGCAVDWRIKNVRARPGKLSVYEKTVFMLMQAGSRACNSSVFAEKHGEDVEMEPSEEVDYRQKNTILNYFRRTNP